MEAKAQTEQALEGAEATETERPAPSLSLEEN